MRTWPVTTTQSPCTWMSSTGRSILRYFHLLRRHAGDVARLAVGGGVGVRVDHAVGEQLLERGRVGLDHRAEAARLQLADGLRERCS